MLTQRKLTNANREMQILVSFFLKSIIAQYIFALKKVTMLECNLKKVK